MRNTSFTVTVPHLFSHISALSAESRPQFTTYRFKFHRTFQTNSSNFLISNNTFNQGT